jgi:type 1 glutamine amidotransferase
MKKRIVIIAAVALLLAASANAAPKLKALIVDGQNNHAWQATTPILQKLLEETGLFTVDVATSPPKGEDMSGFKPNFAAYKLVVSNYNGADWPAETQSAFEAFVRSGGGFVVFHASDNPFRNWKAYNEMIGLGGWEGRNETDGPYFHWRNGKLVSEDKPGPGGHHGKQHEFKVTFRTTNHPITKGLPEVWMHAADELYDHMRGPGRKMTVLATGFSDPQYGGIGEEEPLILTISYGQGRVFHTMLGHGPEQMRSVGFITTLERGAEWAATGKVTQKVPKDFPSPDKVSLRGQ